MLGKTRIGAINPTTVKYAAEMHVTFEMFNINFVYDATANHQKTASVSAIHMNMWYLVVEIRISTRIEDVS